MSNDNSIVSPDPGPSIPGNPVIPMVPEALTAAGSSARRAPADGEAGRALMLVKKSRNVGAGGRLLGKRHFSARAQIRDFMHLHRRQGATLWWCTLSSSPKSIRHLLRRHFQVWRDRLTVHLGLERSAISYAMVDTDEGHGVLHFVMAVPPGKRGGKFWLSYNKLREWWIDIHGAIQCKFEEIGKGEGDVRALSTYIVSQYMVNQTDEGGLTDLLGRFSHSRWPVPRGELRRQVFAMFTRRSEAYNAIGALGKIPDDELFLSVWREIRGNQFRRARSAWRSLMQRGWFDADHGRFCLFGSQLQEV